MAKTTSQQTLRIFVLAFLIAAGVVFLLGVFITARAFNILVYQHQRAFQRWEARKPDHYRYALYFKGALTYQDYLVEVPGGNLVSLTDLRTGLKTDIPGSASTSFLPTNAWIRSNLLIDDLFIRIRRSVRPPNSVNAFFSRTNPALYDRLSTDGWLPPGLATCDPAYPQVRYNPVLGYPEDLQLAGDPCSPAAEYNSPIHVQIDSFQRLP